MFGTVIAAVAGAVIGSAVQGVTAYKTNKQKTEAYRNAANEIQNAADKYSGQNAYNVARADASDWAYNAARNAGEFTANKSNNPGGGLSRIASSNVDAAANTRGDWDANRKLSLLDSAYNRETTNAQNAMKQADVNFNVANQTAKEALSGVGNLANTYNQLKTTGNNNTGDINGK